MILTSTQARLLEVKSRTTRPTVVARKKLVDELRKLTTKEELDYFLTHGYSNVDLALIIKILRKKQWNSNYYATSRHST